MGEVPASCCDFDEDDGNSTATLANSTVTCTLDTAYPVGCLGKAVNVGEKVVMFSFYILLIGFVIEFICIFAACYVAREAKRYTKIGGE